MVQLEVQGTIGQKFYIIADGSVSISKYGDNNQEKNIVILENGDFFGEIALLYTLPRTARVAILETCSFLVLYQNEFTAVLKLLPVDVREEIEKIAKVRISDNSIF